LVGKHAILFVVLEHSKVGLTRHQEAFFHNIHQAEPKEIERNVHEIWCTVRHQSDDLVPNHLRIHGLGNMLFYEALIVGLFHVKVLSFAHKVIRQTRGHQIFKLKQHCEELLTKYRQIFLL